MKHLLWGAAGALLLGVGVVFAVGVLEQASKARPELPGLLPEGALLYLEAKDFSSLLQDWNTSAEKRAWLGSDNHAAFSTSRLFGRLSQAQNEFSAAAGISTDASLLEKVAGKESCLGLYDIGNLEFVYVTRLDQQQIENTPLWQTRGKYEQRTEAGTAFYVHRDTQSSRVAAFAARDGWLILGTREDLVAGVLDRLQGASSHSLSGEGWFVEAIKQVSEARVPAERGDLRMVLNLDKIVPSPYFRSYWIERNITEMKQYASAVSDLYRTPQSYREERVLVRHAGVAATAQGDVQALSALAPEDAAFFSAQASPTQESVLASLRENLMEMKPNQPRTQAWSAPPAVSAENAGNAAQLDVPIDRAPVILEQADAFQPLRTLLHVERPDAELEVYATRAPQNGVFVSLQSAVVLTAPENWDEESVVQALSSALLPGLTAGKLGVHWETRSSRKVPCPRWRCTHLCSGGWQTTVARQRPHPVGEDIVAEREVQPVAGQGLRNLCRTVPPHAGARQLPPVDDSTGSRRSSWRNRPARQPLGGAEPRVLFRKCGQLQPRLCPDGTGANRREGHGK
jgi:hypothetical protein